MSQPGAPSPRDSQSELVSLLREHEAAGAAPQSPPRPAAPPPTRLDAGEDLNRLRALAHAEPEAPVGGTRTAVRPPWHAQANWRAASLRAGRWRWVLLLLAMGALAYWLNRPVPSVGADTPLAQTVQAVAEALLDRVRAQGSLPTTLRDLRDFPADAREMEATGLQQAPGPGTEFFYFRTPPAQFTLIGRRAGEAWIYESKASPPLRPLH